MKGYCRVPSVVDAWRLALEFARSTTVKHKVASRNQSIKIRLVRLCTALAVKTRKDVRFFTSGEIIYDNAPRTKRKGKNELQNTSETYLLILTLGSKKLQKITPKVLRQLLSM